MKKEIESMNIEPFKNDIGASVDCDLRTIKIDEIEKIKCHK